MFGNITGGGTLSSKTNYNPTPYVDIILKDFSKITKNLNTQNQENIIIEPIIYQFFKKENELEF
jgi:hypothetical protein